MHLTRAKSGSDSFGVPFPRAVRTHADPVIASDPERAAVIDRDRSAPRSTAGPAHREIASSFVRCKRRVRPPCRSRGYRPSSASARTSFAEQRTENLPGRRARPSSLEGRKRMPLARNAATYSARRRPGSRASRRRQRREDGAGSAPTDRPGGADRSQIFIRHAQTSGFEIGHNSIQTPSGM